MLAAMQEALKIKKEEEEKARLAEEERIRKEEEAEAERLEKKRIEEEKKALKKQREKERKEQLRKEGKLLTAKQKAEKARAEQMLAAMRAQGMKISENYTFTIGILEEILLKISIFEPKAKVLCKHTVCIAISRQNSNFRAKSTAHEMLTNNAFP